MKIILFLLLALGFSSAKADENEIIKKVNSNNAAIQSYVADMDIVLRKRALTFTAVGKSYYEKPKSYRLQTTNVRTNQLGSDIGSNNDIFWFWIRRLDPNTMHFSKYKDLMNTNLPDSLQPNIMMDTLGIGQINTKRTSIRTENSIIIVQEITTSPRQQEIIKVTLVDPDRPAIKGFRLYSRSGKMFALCDIQSYFKANNGAYFPQQSVTKWYTEQITIGTTVRNPQINVKIDPKTFQIPQYNGLKVIDIGKQKIDFQEGR